MISVIHQKPLGPKIVKAPLGIEMNQSGYGRSGIEAARQESHRTSLKWGGEVETVGSNGFKAAHLKLGSAHFISEKHLPSHHIHSVLHTLWKSNMVGWKIPT